MNNQNSNIKDIENLVIEHDKGARKLTGFLLSASLFIALFWSLFQIWVYSDFQLFFSKLYFWEKFNLNSDILYFNNNIAKRVHLLFALLLAFIFYPAFKQSSRNHIPIYDWIFILLTLISIGYVLVNYNEIAYRIGDFNDKDMFFSIIIVIISLEAVRRIVGIPLLIIAIIIFLYTVFGDLAILPEELQHKSYSIKKVITQITLTSEGIFGIALGVSSEFVFLFVLFGALLERSGAGNYFINVSFALLGHMKGGPAKAAIIASAATGSITGSSIANVVTTGTFTIPLMRKIGFSRDKSAALEVSSSVNGQIMPPVMGAAAFLIVEYVGITYSQLIQNALLPIKGALSSR